MDLKSFIVESASIVKHFVYTRFPTDKINSSFWIR